MSIIIDIVQWLEDGELIDRIVIDSNDEVENQVEVNNENADMENSNCESESELNSDNVGPMLQNNNFFGKDNTRW